MGAVIVLTFAVAIKTKAILNQSHNDKTKNDIQYFIWLEVAFGFTYLYLIRMKPH